ncbi:4-hydroxyphenylacetate degradation bifunctional isomerase/decarboxylase subunit HpaG2 [Anopheles sinensis]|uniref:4-hydroxyphenylacetate degradation bifunctional isomerase/decarboxylase subunit HpaG2 n=1 Tax=Anopheles sinensis TaxID=74873 RepID=A0A084VKH5_ANOSI|nr:4-hydroxyphenylacetate degradation bifunctional isomerase/decarboxylase subunit HpaG2 [Anopheles sinensis]
MHLSPPVVPVSVEIVHSKSPLAIILGSSADRYLPKNAVSSAEYGYLMQNDCTSSRTALDFAAGLGRLPMVHVGDENLGCTWDASRVLTQ